MAPPDHSISQIFFHFEKILGLPENQCNQKLRSAANNPAYKPFIIALAKQAPMTVTSTLEAGLKECTKATEKQRKEQKRVRDERKEAHKLEEDRLEKALEDKSKVDAEVSRKRAAGEQVEASTPRKKIKTKVPITAKTRAGRKPDEMFVTQDSDSSDQTVAVLRKQTATHVVSPNQKCLAYRRSPVEEDDASDDGSATPRISAPLKTPSQIREKSATITPPMDEVQVEHEDGSHDTIGGSTRKLDFAYVSRIFTNLQSGTGYEAELATTRGTPPDAIKDYCITTLGAMYRTQRLSISPLDEYNAIVSYTCTKFDPDVVQRELIKLLSTHSQNPETIRSGTGKSSNQSTMRSCISRIRLMTG